MIKIIGQLQIGLETTTVASQRSESSNSCLVVLEKFKIKLLTPMGPFLGWGMIFMVFLESTHIVKELLFSKFSSILFTSFFSGWEGGLLD